MKTLNKIGHLVPKQTEIPNDMMYAVYKCEHCGREQSVQLDENGNPRYRVGCYGVDCPKCTYINVKGNMDLIGKVIDFGKGSEIKAELMIVIEPLSDKYCLTLGQINHSFSIIPIKFIRQMIREGLEYQSSSSQ